MSRITILPVPLRNKIAAGEVIERPASVVKELIENALDAGATDVRADILHGGKRLMKVSDNGIGMDRNDALLCVERHATSKLVNEDDLFSIRTLGFRGEALASVASVSRMKIVTAPRGNPIGTLLVLEGGEVREIKDAPAIGTTVEVRDLFFNTPARKKFLKSTGTELFHIIDTVTKASLPFWDIGFRLSTDHKETFCAPIASSQEERVIQIYGDDFMRGLTRVDAEESGMRCTAFVSRSTNFRATKCHQYVFLNRRPVKDQSLAHAVYKAYEGVLPAGRHPMFFLFLEVDPATVDVNVHPTKREVRFRDKEVVYAFVHSAIRASVKGERSEFARQFTTMLPQNASLEDAAQPAGPALSLRGEEKIVAEAMEIPYRHIPPHIYIGDTFVALAGRDGLTLIDHHAAHERILYEKFLKGAILPAHQLLFPKQVALSPGEHAVIRAHADTLAEFGIEVEDFGQNTLIVRSLPDVLHNADIRGILSDIASILAEGGSPGKPHKESLAARIACHSSIRGKAHLNEEELTALLDDLERTERPDQCPHGRPTRIFFTLDDLRKMFKRK